MSGGPETTLQARTSTPVDTPLRIADRDFTSRLIVGTGKYRDNQTMVAAIEASGAEMVTVAVRRIDLDRGKEEGILHHLDPERYFLLANTAGCYTAEDAIRYARLARAAGFNEWLKLEVIGDQATLLPDTMATLSAAEVLVAEGFKIMAYTNDDLISALRLEDVGCVAVMPLASPIGSGLGVVNPYYIREIKSRCQVPIIVDAGVGTKNLVRRRSDLLRQVDADRASLALNRAAGGGQVTLQRFVLIHVELGDGAEGPNAPTG